MHAADSLAPQTPDASADAKPDVEEGLDAPAEAFELLSAPRGAPDDFAKIRALARRSWKKLNEGGIFHYWQIAAMTPADVTKVEAELKLGGRIERDGWINQAARCWRPRPEPSDWRRPRGKIAAGVVHFVMDKPSRRQKCRYARRRSSPSH